VKQAGSIGIVRPSGPRTSALWQLNKRAVAAQQRGSSLAPRYFGVNQYISVPVTAVVLGAITASRPSRSAAAEAI